MEGLADQLQNAKLRTRKSPAYRGSKRSYHVDDDGQQQHPYSRYIPNAVQKDTGMNTLHVALLKRAPVEVITKILEDEPDSIKHQDAANLTPLHRCLYVEDIVFRKDLFFILLEGYPEAASIPDKANGDFPLHTACRYIEQTIDKSSGIWAEYESSLGDDEDNRGEEAMARDVKNTRRKWKKDVEVVRRLIDAYPQASSERNRYLRTPLHYVLKNTDAPPRGFVDALLDAMEPSRLKGQDKSGRTPLLLGIKFRAPVEVLQTTFEAFPGAAAVGDWEETDNDETLYQKLTPEKDGLMSDEEVGITVRNGNLPLHLAIRHKYPELFLLQLLQEFPEAAKIRDRMGQLPLHVALLHDCEANFIHELLNTFPDATEVEGAERGWPFLHSVLRYSHVKPVAIAMVVKHSPSTVIERRKDKYVLPLHVAMAHSVHFDIVALLLEEYLDAVMYEDYYDNNEYPLQYGLRALEGFIGQGEESDRANIIKSIRLVLSKFPKAAKMRDSTRQTPLFRLCHILKDVATPTQDCSPEALELLREMYEAYPDAVEMACSFGASPIDSLVEECILARSVWDGSHVRVRSLDVIVKKMKIVLGGLRDGRSLRQLCQLTGWKGRQVTITSPQLKIFFLMFDQSEAAEEPTNDNVDRVAELDLNRQVIAGWTLLEILADFDTPEASTVLLQIVEDQKKLLRSSSPEEIQVRLESNGFATKATFRSMVPVDNAVLTKVADRAKLCSSPDCKKFGKGFGRFRHRYRLDEAPKHISETCLVVFATESVENAERQQYEEPVALKFMMEKHHFESEITNREATRGVYVMRIKAFYACEREEDMELSCGHIAERHFGVEGLDEELREHLALDATRNNFCYLLVMERGAGVDLHDVINHRNIAGRDLLAVLSIAQEIAMILQFLNEGCLVIHGDVKARNFVALGIGVLEFRAIDLDNAASIKDSEVAGKKRTSSGYLPPEMAAVEIYRRSGKDLALESGVSLIDKMKADLQIALQADDFLRVSAISQELVQITGSSGSESTMQQPAEVTASKAIDMWSFGALLYFLCTGIQLFNVDVREEVVEEEDLLALQKWDDDLKASKLSKVGPLWPKHLLSHLLEKDPNNRPKDWAFIIDELQKAGTRFETLPSRKGGHVFISYCRRDTEIMLQIYNYLVDHGVPTWMDVELTPGTAGWTHKIEKALEDANLVVAICSPSSKKSEWVAKELLQAKDQGVPILPVLVDGEAARSVPFAIYDIQHIDIRGAISTMLPAILQSVKHCLEA